MDSGRSLVDLSHPVVDGEVGWIGLPAPRIEPWMTHEASRERYGGLAEFEISQASLVGNAGSNMVLQAYQRFWPSRSPVPICTSARSPKPIGLSPSRTSKRPA